MVMELVNGTAPHADKATYSLLKADAEAVKKMWPSVILPGLLRIKEKDKRSGFWQPEHVRANLEAGFRGAFLCELYFILNVAKTSPVGFLIVKAYNDEFIGVPTDLFVWIAWCEDAPVEKVIPFASPVLEKRALELGLQEIRGITSRLAWAKKLTPFGYEIKHYVFSKKLAVRSVHQRKKVRK